ncbi:MAG: alpha-L-fucosidase [Chitinophagaceae bacterium]
MKKLLAIVSALLLFLNYLSAQNLSDAERLKWWHDARFGMFIHWGVYSQWAGVYHDHEQRGKGAEWIMNVMKIPIAEYQDSARHFNPVKFNADEWVKVAKASGMKYIVITAKHHDGFALFKSSASKWNIVDATPYGKDILKQLAEACKRHGMKLGFYYSQAQDWNNPGGSVTRNLSSVGWSNPDSSKIDAYTKDHSGHWDPAQETSTFDEYIDRVSVPQVRELLTNYGEVSVLWWDTPTGMTDTAALKLQALLKLQPNIITNDRLKRPNFPGDTKTPEQRIPTQSELDRINWETCMTMNGTWGYRTSDNNWKSAKTLIQNLADIASKGGNYLLNVGPKPDGTFPQQSIDTLKKIGQWMKINGEAIYETKASPLPALDWGRCTRKEGKAGTTLYLFVFQWPKDGKLIVPGIKAFPSSAKLLANGHALSIIPSATGEMIVSVPEKAPDPSASVIRLEF